MGLAERDGLVSLGGVGLVRTSVHNFEDLEETASESEA